MSSADKETGGLPGSAVPVNVGDRGRGDQTGLCQKEASSDQTVISLSFAQKYWLSVSYSL